MCVGELLLDELNGMQRGHPRVESDVTVTAPSHLLCASRWPVCDAELVRAGGWRCSMPNRERDTKQGQEWIFPGGFMVFLVIATLAVIVIGLAVLM